MAKETNDIEALKAQLAALEAEKAEWEQKESVFLDVNKDLQEKLVQKDATIDEVLPNITVDKKQYRVLVKQFSYKGESYTYDALKKNKELQKTLVEIGSGILKPL